MCFCKGWQGCLAWKSASTPKWQTALHLVLRAWSDEQVASRSISIERLTKSKDGQTIREMISQADVAIEMTDADRVVELRRRLGHISWFMKALCEHIGRRANRRETDGDSAPHWSTVR